MDFPHSLTCRATPAMTTVAMRHFEVATPWQSMSLLLFVFKPEDGLLRRRLLAM